MNHASNSCLIVFWTHCVINARLSTNITNSTSSKHHQPVNCHRPADLGGRSSLHLGGMFDFLGAWFCRSHPFECHVTWPPRNGWLVQTCYERNTSSFGVGISSADFLQKFDVRPSIFIICNDLRRVKVDLVKTVKTLGIPKDHGLEIILQTRHDATPQWTHPLPGFLVPLLVVRSPGSLPLC